MYTEHVRISVLKRSGAYFLVSAIALLVLMAADLVLGSASLSVRDLFTTDLGKDILVNFRIPKAVVALVSGMALAVCGLQMQTLFRNPLADPTYWESAAERAWEWPCI